LTHRDESGSKPVHEVVHFEENNSQDVQSQQHPEEHEESPGILATMKAKFRHMFNLLQPLYTPRLRIYQLNLIMHQNLRRVNLKRKIAFGDFA
jgi:hypothetical protein